MNTDDFTVAWRAWYDFGKGPIEYTSQETTLDDLPDDGFQAMRLWYADGTGRFISGNDYYFFYERPDGIAFCQSNDSTEDIRTRYPGASIKRGKHVPEEVIKRINDTMVISQNPCKSC